MMGVGGLFAGVRARESPPLVESEFPALPTRLSDAEVLAELKSAQQEADVIESGADAFVMHCQACHGRRAEGIIGPNLTDAYWLVGDGSPLTTYRSISDGKPQRGCPSWRSIMSARQMASITLYLQSVAGTNEPGKEPQGERVE